MGRRDVVVIGASAGGVEALRTLVAGLPEDFPAAVLVVLHVPPTSPSALPTILRRSGALPVQQASDGDPMTPGRILVAPPDRHLIVYDGRVTLSRGPRENGHRPAVDVLFRSAAGTVGPRTIGVVLSGALDDGAAGMVAISTRQGVCVVQDPEDALHPSMPSSAIDAAAPSHVVPADKIAPLLVQLVQEEIEAVPDGPSDLMEMETAMAELSPDAMHELDRPGQPAGLSCPDCNGSLFEIHEGELVRYRCRVGHAWSPESLLAQQSSSMEGALWMALRSLEEKAALAQDMATRARARGHARSAARFEDDEAEATRAAGLVRALISRAASGAISLAARPEQRA